MQIIKPRRIPIIFLLLVAAACSGPDAVPPGNGKQAEGAAVDPPIIGAVDGIPGWTRTGPPERFNKEGLYGYIDGGAEIVLQYGFREIAVSKFRPAASSGSEKEIVLEIYRMSSGEAAFGLYSTKLEGGEQGRPMINPDNWLSPGQASFVKGDFLVNVLSPECTEKEIGEFMAAVEPKIPGHGTARPKGLRWLPVDGMVPSSWHYIRGPLAAQNESPFLEGDFWGFGEKARDEGVTEAYAAKYGARPVISKLIVVRFAKPPANTAAEDGVSRLFEEYLQGVKHQGEMIEGRNDAGRWFMFKRSGSIAALVLGDPDEAAARARLDGALALAASHQP